MNSDIQSILIRRKSKVYFKPETSSPAQINPIVGMLGAVIGNFGSLGYVMSKELLNSLEFASTFELKSFYKDVFPILQKQTGNDNRWFKPMYPNFPEQVANASEEELYINAILHYLGDAIGRRITPDYKKEERFPFCESTEPRFLGLATSTEIDGMWLEIFESKASPSVQDKEDIKVFFESDQTNFISKVPEFTNKERMAYVLAYMLKNDFSMIGSIWMKKTVKTATDVLRIACAYSGGDESLTKPTKFGKFPRPIRKLLLNLLNELDQNNVKEDLMRHRNAWIRLGEKLHPGEYEKQLPFIGTSIRNLRNDMIRTTNSMIEANLSGGHWYTLLEILKTRPGDFARRLNAILSRNDNKFEVLAAFQKVADKVSAPVLWQLYGYFKSRDEQMKFRNRLFLPKTPMALVSENNLIAIDKAYQIGIVQIIEKALEVIYFNQGCDLGKVWIDPVCHNLLIPSGNRSTSQALRQVGRGSRFQLGLDKSTVRLFVYWKDVEAKDEYRSRVDLDLSAVMYDKDWKFISQCSWTNLRNGMGKEVSMAHSGDITSAPNGASEFLDINLDKLHKDVAYIACDVFNYTGQKFTDLKIGYCGWMEREYAGSGEIFEPKSVVNRCDLTADVTSTCPMILDVNNKEIIWADLPITLSGSCYSTESTADKAVATAELVSRMGITKASLHDLFNLHVKARNGIIVDNREDANFVIAEDGDLSPYDIAKVTNEWL